MIQTWEFVSLNVVFSQKEEEEEEEEKVVCVVSTGRTSDELARDLKCSAAAHTTLHHLKRRHRIFHKHLSISTFKM
jgi:hypothetical protein